MGDASGAGAGAFNWAAQSANAEVAVLVRAEGARVSAT